MTWKKFVSVLIGLLLLGMTVGASSVSATESEASVTVILVSDNMADSGIARLLANATGGVVVTTPWGIYDPNVTAEILSYAPDRVIIIGGPMAVVEQYVSDLEGYNITVYRWGGMNRYETNLIALQMAKKMGLIKEENVTVIAPGKDTVAIEQAIKLALQNGGVVVYVNKTVLIDKVNKTVSLKKIIVVHTPVTEKIAKGIMKKLARANAPVTNVTVNVNVSVQCMERAIQLRINRILKIANLTNSSELVELANNLTLELQKVNELIQEGNVTEAYKKLLWLQVRTQFALKKANFIMAKEMGTGKVGILVKLWRIEAELQILQRIGINVSEYNQTLLEIEGYIKAGNYGEAMKLLNQLEKEIRALYKENRTALRQYMRSHKGKDNHRGWWQNSGNQTIVGKP
jgi:putative cell wall-binding protein